MRTLALPDLESPATITLGIEDRLSPEAFEELCLANPDLRLELTSKGEIVIVPPIGFGSAFHECRVTSDLDRWAIQDGRGYAIGANGTFTLATGAVLAPDAAWIAKERVDALNDGEFLKLARLCPDFVIEVMSQSDRLPAARAKMEEWLAGGVSLGWLIHPGKKTVYIYRPNQPSEERIGISQIEGEAPVVGFGLRLEPLWALRPQK